MTAVPYSYNSGPLGKTIALFGSKGAKMVPDSHANFDTIKELLDEGNVQVGSEAEDHLYEMADATATVQAKLRKLSERVALAGNTITFDGVPVESRLAQHVVEMVQAQDENWKGFVLLLENLHSNPSKKSRKGFFRFIDKNGLTVTERGTVIAYKGVASDGKSIHQGREPVTVTVDGESEVHTGRVPYPAGATVEMARDLVDPDRESACSVGLHVGTHAYALGYSTSGHFLTVEINPRDVVETPSDSNGEKVRVCRLVVLEENEDKTRYEGTSYVEDDDEEEYDYTLGNEELGIDGPTFGSF